MYVELGISKLDGFNANLKYLQFFIKLKDL